jgi:hypothetical protein
MDSWFWRYIQDDLDEDFAFDDVRFLQDLLEDDGRLEPSSAPYKGWIKTAIEYMRAPEDEKVKKRRQDRELKWHARLSYVVKLLTKLNVRIEREISRSGLKRYWSSSKGTRSKMSATVLGMVEKGIISLFIFISFCLAQIRKCRRWLKQNF